mmetsp:Transcript_11252/g.23803  ORF Transcript_11252/g.23803 Transcript_11252/m.23803 type:complete len:206 (-) Transcript_11252:54-671(-)
MESVRFLCPWFVCSSSAVVFVACLVSLVVDCLLIVLFRFVFCRSIYCALCLALLPHLGIHRRMNHRRSRDAISLDTRRLVLACRIALHRIACRLASAVAAARDEHAGECGALKQPPAGGRVVHLSDRALLQGRGGVPHATTRGGARGAFVSVHDRGQETVRHPGGRGQFGRDGPGQVPFEVGQQQFAQGLGEHGAAYCLGPVRSG